MASKQCWHSNKLDPCRKLLSRNLFFKVTTFGDLSMVDISVGTTTTPLPPPPSRPARPNRAKTSLVLNFMFLLQSSAVLLICLFTPVTKTPLGNNWLEVAISICYHHHHYHHHHHDHHCHHCAHGGCKTRLKLGISHFIR